MSTEISTLPHDETGSGLRIAMIVLLILSWLTMLLRSCVRLFLLKHFGLDDWLMLITIISATIWQSFQFVGIHYALGRHMWDVTDEQFSQGLKYWYLAEPGYAATTTLLKIALGAFLVRVCIKPLHIKIIWGNVIVSTLFGLAFFVVIIFQCSPISDFWLNYMPGVARHCFSNENIIAMSYGHAAMMVVVDLTLGIIPCFIAGATTLPLRLKIIVAVLLAFGSLGSIATIIRIPAIRILDSNDFLYQAVELAYFSTIEPQVGIIAGNLATLRPLLQLWQRKRSMWRTNRTTYNETVAHGKTPDMSCNQSSGISQSRLTGVFKHPVSSVTMKDMEAGMSVVTRLDSDGFPVENENRRSVF